MKKIFIVFIFLYALGTYAQNSFSTFKVSSFNNYIKELDENGIKYTTAFEYILRDVYFIFDKDGKQIDKFLGEEKLKKYESSIYKINKKSLKVKKFIVNLEGEEESFFSKLSFDFGTGSFESYLIKNDATKTSYFNKQKLKKNFTINYKNFDAQFDPELEFQKSFDDPEVSRLEFKNAFISLQKDNYKITLGRQMIQWGIFDELSEFDILTGKNDEMAFFFSGEDLRISSDLLLAQFFLPNSKLDAFVLVPRSNQSFSRHDGIYGIFKDGRFRGADEKNNLFNSVNFHNEADTSLNWGLRYSFNFLTLESQLLIAKYLDHTEEIRFSEALIKTIQTQIPTLSALSDGVVIKREQRMILGASFLKQLDAGLIKVEFTLRDNFRNVTNKFEVVNYSVATYNFGFERNIETFDVGFVGQYRFSTKSNNELLDESKESVLFLEFNKKLLSDKLELKLRSLVEFDKSSYFLSPQLEYFPDDNTSLYLKYNSFGGDEDSVFGFNKDDKAIFLGVKVFL